MRKTLCIIFLLTPALASSDVETKYSLEYQGLSPGKTSYEQLISKFGRGEQDKSKFGLKINYELFDVTFSVSQNKINTIIVYDHSYLDINGLKIGDSVSEFKMRKPCFIYRKSTVTDFEKGQVYWISDGKISKIVLSSDLVFKLESTLRADPEFKSRCPIANSMH